MNFTYISGKIWAFNTDQSRTKIFKGQDMIMISWRGKGPLVIFILIAFGILEHFLIPIITRNEEYTQQHYWPLTLTFILAGITMWFVGKHLNRNDVLYKDPATGEIFAIKNYHQFMDMPMQYFSILMAIAAIVTIVGSFYATPNNNVSKKVTKPSLVDPITFNSRKLKLTFTNKNSKNWISNYGDNLALYYTEDEIDTPNKNASLNEIRDFYRKKAAIAEGAIVEVDKFQNDGLEGIRAIIKAPLADLAMSYNGYLIIPDAKGYYIFKMTCVEEGTTGLREAGVMLLLRKEEKIKINEKDGTISGWSQDPYDANYNAKAKIMLNISEDKKYDQQFPRHPLSRLRAIFDQIQPSIKLANNAQNNNQVDKSTEKSN